MQLELDQGLQQINGLLRILCSVREKNKTAVGTVGGIPIVFVVGQKM